MRGFRVIAAILAGGALVAQARTSTAMRAEIEVWSISFASDDFEACYGVFPPETNWFAELTASTNAVLNEKKIKFLSATGTTDPWSRDFVYRQPGKHNTPGVDVYSLGQDGKSASEGDDPDDINNWNSTHPWRLHYSGFHIRFGHIVRAIGGTALLLALYKFILCKMKSRHPTLPHR